MNKFKMFLLIFISVIIQIAIIPNFKIFGSYANLTLAFTIALSFNYGSYVGGYLGLIMGFIEDLLFSQVIGVKALIYFVIGFLVGYNEDLINKDDIRTGVVITAISTAVYWISNSLIYRVLGNQLKLNLDFNLIVEIILNMVLYILCHYLLNNMIRKRKFKF